MIQLMILSSFHSWIPELIKMNTKVIKFLISVESLINDVKE